MKTKAISRAVSEITIAEKVLEEVLTVVLPPNTKVFWNVGGHRQYGEIKRNVTDRVEVLNHRTGKTYLLHAYKFMSEYGGGVQ